MKVYIGIDVGGTKAHAGLITEKGNILRSKEVPSRVKESNAAARHAIMDLIAEMKGDAKIHGIGIGVAGHVDHVRNRVAEAGPNFLPRFEKIDLVPKLVKEYEVPVIIENDAKVYALGEAVFGKGKGYRRVVTMTLGTGIGGGIIQDGKIVHGKNNLAGELGQMFTRGSKKRWEQIAAGAAFNKHGDVQKGAIMIAEGVNNILNVLDPDIIVVGGGLSREKGLVEAIKKEVRNYVFYKPLQKTPIVKSSLVRNAPILGAMLVVHTGRD